MDITLESFIPFILDPETDDFNLQIAQRDEFARFGALAYEPRPPPGGRYRHQEFGAFYFLLYQTGLIIHRPGTGKTCFATAVAETLKNFRNEEQNISPKIKRVFVISNPTPLGNFREEVICRCTNGIYNKRQTTQSINKALNQYYSFLTFTELSNLAKELDDFNIPLFNNSLFIIDEIHNLISEGRETQSHYDLIWNIFHQASGIKKIGLTATPMSKSAEEFQKILNLFLPEDQQLDQITRREPSYLWDYFKGKISYLREMTNVDVDIVYQGISASSLLETPNPAFDVKIVPCRMERFQYETYSRVVRNSGRKQIYTEPITASFIVYPDGSYGKVGYDANIGDHFQFRKRFADHLRRETPEAFINSIRPYSSKIAKEMEIMVNAPGKGMSYHEHREISGFPVIACAIWGLGYELFPIESIAEEKKENYCPSKTSFSTNLTKRKRIGYISSGISEPRIHNFLNFFNSKENVDGEYCKWIVLTPIGREGLSLFDVQDIVIGDSWTPTVDEQAKFRALRANSHQNLIEKYGNIITVNIYHLAIDLGKNYLASETDKIYNVDLTVYFKSWEKDIIIRPYRKLYKQMAFDGFINRERNQQPDEIDFSTACDNDTCTYDLFVGSTEMINPLDYDYEVDYSWYNSHPSTDDLTTIREYLNEKFLTKNVLNITEMSQELNLSSKIIFPHLFFMAEEKETFANRLGFQGFLAFSFRDVAIVPHPGADFSEYLYFEDFRFTILPDDWSKIITKELMVKSEVKVKTIFANTSIDIYSKVGTMSNPEKSQLLETAFLVFVDTTASQDQKLFAKKVISLFKPRWFKFNDKTFLSIMMQNATDKVNYLTPMNNVVYRIFEDGIWRDTTDEEKNQYKGFVIAEITKREKKGIDFGLYGFSLIDKDDNYIVQNSQTILTNEKKKCATIGIAGYVRIFFLLNIQVPHVNGSEKEKNRVFTETGLDPNPEESDYFYSAIRYIQHYQAKETCKQIAIKLNQEGMFYLR